MQSGDPEHDWRRIELLPAIQRLSPHGVAYLKSAIAMGPSRKVGAGALFSNSGALAIEPGRSVGFDSESGEATFALLSLLEQVPLLLSQPPQLTVYAHDRRGRRQARRQRMDFLVVTTKSVSLVEVKPLAKLEQKQALCPADWQVTQGEWSYLPGVEVARHMGMGHQVFYPEKFSPQYRANIRYLVEMQRNPGRRLPDRAIRCIQKSLLERPKSIGEVTERYTEIAADDLLRLIASKKIFGLIHHQTISLDFVLFGSAAQRDLHQVEVESFRLSDLQPNSLAYRLARATEKELKHAIASLERYRERRKDGQKMDARDYRNRAGIEAAIAEGAPPIAGLIPRFSERGGEGTPLSQETAEALAVYLKAYLKSIKRTPSASQIHAELIIEWGGTEKHIPCVETIRRYLASTYTREQAAAVYGGARAIQKARRKTPGDQCNERLNFGGMWAHCDAVYSDIVPKGVDEKDWRITRPIVFPLVMAGSQFIAAAGVLLGSPSRLGFFMALRLCIKTHGWLPASICHDCGTEFVNKAWREASTVLGVDRVRRPIAASRSGAEVEMVNGQLNRYLQTLPGGTYHDQAGRSSDGKRKGRRTAQHNLSEVVNEIEGWIETWNSTRHGDHGLTPKEAFDRELRAFPSSVRRIAMSEMTCYQTSYPIEANAMTYERGLAYSGKKYSCNALSSLIHRGEYPTALRIDSLDPSIIRGKSSQGIVCLTSNDHHRIAGMDRVQRILAVSERLRYHATSKRNQSDYQVALAQRRKEMAAKAKSGDVTKVGESNEVKVQHAPRSSTPSFSELLGKQRPRLEVIGE